MIVKEYLFGFLVSEFLFDVCNCDSCIWDFNVIVFCFVCVFLCYVIYLFCVMVLNYGCLFFWLYLLCVGKCGDKFDV